MSDCIALETAWYSGGTSMLMGVWQLISVDLTVGYTLQMLTVLEFDRASGSMKAAVWLGKFPCKLDFSMWGCASRIICLKKIIIIMKHHQPIQDTILRNTDL